MRLHNLENLEILVCYLQFIYIYFLFNFIFLLVKVILISYYFRVGC